MPPKGNKQTQEKQLQAALKEEFGITDQEPEKINLGDNAALKRALCDGIIDVVNGAGYPIDHKITDLKITLGLLACAVACVGQFWPTKDPWNRTVLIITISAYVVLSTLLTLVATLIEKDIIAITKPGESGTSLVVHATLPRYSDKFKLLVKDKGAKAGSGREITLEKSLGAYFDTTGVLVKDVLKTDIEKLLQDFEQLENKKSK